MHKAFTKSIMELFGHVQMVSTRSLLMGEGPEDEAILTYDDGSDECSLFVTMQEL